MPKAERLIDEALGLLQSFSQDTDQVTTLKYPIGPADLTFTVTVVRSGAMGISPGVVEIDAELIYVESVDDDGTVTVTPWGRGYGGTDPVSHLANIWVTSQPTYPRAKVLDALNETILRIFPKVFVPKLVNLSTHIPSITYDLPEDAEWVLDARWQPPSGTGYWTAVQRWRMSRGGTTVTGDPGVSVDIADPVIPSCPLEVTYAAKPTAFTSEDDDFEAVTGLSLSMKDVIVTGAAAGNLVASQELSRLQMSSIEQQNRAGLVAPSAALTSSRWLEAKFQQRLGEEIDALRRRYPIRITRSWI